MRCAWIAAATALVAACSTTNIENVTNVASVDGGEPDDAIADAGPDDAATEDVVTDASGDASSDASECNGSAPQGAATTQCRITDACSACGDGGYVYKCMQGTIYVDGKRPNLSHCAVFDGKTCCQAEWMRAPEDDGFCGNPDFAKAFVGPNGSDGNPILPSTGCLKRGAPDGFWTYMLCCPDGVTP